LDHPALTVQGELAVVHLVVKDYGLDAFRRFIRSYRAFPAGVAHQLLIAAKQFDSMAQLELYREELVGLEYQIMPVPDEGFDLGTYLRIARATDYHRYCFLNSLCEVLAPDWLAKLARAADQAPGGIAGATGSLESVASDALHHIGYTSRWPAMIKPLRGILGYLKLLPAFPTFPNPHIRTNAFMIERETFLSVNHPVVSDKADAWRFESGRNGLTRQVLKRGGKALVVDADGATYPVEEWYRSRTFWQGEQEGLLVADKQTRMYRDADAERRRELRRGAWGRTEA